MYQYKNLVERILLEGKTHSNRTGVNTVRVIGHHLRFKNIYHQFPIITTKHVPWKSCFGEMMGFLRGYDNAADFRKLGCKVWDDNANKNQTWLNNEFRLGEDDLGRIYGVQARQWRSLIGFNKSQTPTAPIFKMYDQLHNVVTRINSGEDDRRLVVSHWNVHDLSKMSLVPCHVLYQFSIEDGFLDLSMYQRSCDVALGLPFNISGYAWLLSVIAWVTNFVPRDLNIYLHDVHIYEDHIETLKKQMREPEYGLPKLDITEAITTFDSLATCSMDHFSLINYQHGPKFHYKMAI